MNEVTEQELDSSLYMGAIGAERDEILTKFMSPLTAIYFENYLDFFAAKLYKSHNGSLMDIHSISRNGKVESIYFDLGYDINEFGLVRDINELVEVESMGWQRNVTCTWKALGAALALIAYSQLAMRLYKADPEQAQLLPIALRVFETDPEQAQLVSKAYHTLLEFVLETKAFTKEEQKQILTIIAINIAAYQSC